MRAWEEFLTKQELEIGKEAVDKWLRPLKVVQFDACNLYLEASDSFQATWFDEHMQGRVQKGLYNNNHKQIKVHLSTPSRSQAPLPAKTTKKNFPQRPSLPSFTLRFDTLDSSATFENFVTLPSNLLVYKLLIESCEREKNDPSSLQFNPIYLYGRKGTGKTHLMMAFAAQLVQKGKKVLYVRAETFTEHVVEAIRSAEMQTFRKVYRGIDALLIDDIEVFSRKGATQEELFHTFNTLHGEGKQIVLSATTAPQELKFIEPRLISRFEWGIVIPLHMPSKEQMRTILLQKACQTSYELSESVVAFLLQTFSANTKTLIRAFDALLLRNANETAPLSVNAAQNCLKDLIYEEEKAALTPGKIIRAVAEYYGIRMDDILSKSQAREAVLPRHLAMHLCRQYLNLPFMKIGDIFARDHSTVMASIKQIQKGLDTKNQEITTPLGGILKLLDSP
jgi:chromosomal replication initiator protein